ncbi:MAG: restriction endonuclease [Deltaproteobacteria bacterium]|nr:MAG: restriction endonuclease [Deltaproteobacteria bacterium]
MIIAGVYSFKKGREVIEEKFGNELIEIRRCINAVDSKKHRGKISEEQTMVGRTLYSPTSLNKSFEKEFNALHWYKNRITCKYSTEYYTDNYQPPPTKTRPPYREMDFVKNRLGIEVQFGKYAFMVYNVCAKMTIFNKLGIIDAGVEIVPVKEFANDMSTGVSYFEQFIWDLEHRGISDIDIPVLILGIAGN